MRRPACERHRCDFICGAEKLAKCRPRALLLLLPSAVVRTPVRCGLWLMFRGAGHYLENVHKCSLSFFRSLFLSLSLCLSFSFSLSSASLLGVRLPNWCSVQRFKSCKVMLFWVFVVHRSCKQGHPSPINPSGQRHPQRGLPRWAHKPPQGLTPSPEVTLGAFVIT